MLLCRVPLHEPCQSSFIFHCLMYQSQQAAMLRSLRRPALSHISIVYTARGTIYQHPPQTRGLMQHAGSTLSPLSPNTVPCSFTTCVCQVVYCSFVAHLWAADKAMGDEGLWLGLLAHVVESSEWVYRSQIDCGPSMGLFSPVAPRFKLYTLYSSFTDTHQLANTSDNPPVAVPSLISTTAHMGKKNCPSMRREILTWPSLSLTA